MQRMCAIIAGILLVLTTNSFAYTPPIGIPDPGLWGSIHPVEGVAPATATKCPAWPTAQTAGCYYIDNTHANKTDVDNTYGYPDKPRATPPGSGTSSSFKYVYAAGSYVEIHGGPYTLNVYPEFQGTSDNPVWFRGVSTPNRPMFNSGLRLGPSAYTVIENLEFADLPTTFYSNAIKIVNMASHHIAIRNNYFHDLPFPYPTGTSIGAAVIDVSPSQGGDINNLVVYNNSFTRIGDRFTLNDDDIHCMTFGLWSVKPPSTLNTVWILNNSGIDIGGSFFQLNGNQTDATTALAENRTETNLDNLHHFYAGKNLVHLARQSLGAPKFARDIIYSQNEAYENFSQNTGVGTGMSYQEGSHRVWYIFNKIHNEMFGIRSSNISIEPTYRDAVNFTSYMIGNVIYNIYNGPTVFYYNRDDIYKPAQAIKHEQGFYNHRYMVDNTIYNVGGGITLRGLLADDTSYIFGNVISGVNGIDTHVTPNVADYHMLLIDGINKYDYNLFEPHETSGTIGIRDTTSPVQRMYTLSDVVTNTDECSHCVADDPLFVNASTGDFRPQAASPLVDASVENEVYGIFETLYGINIRKDFNGVSRPQGAGWDIGAYEYFDGGPSPIKIRGFRVTTE